MGLFNNWFGEKKVSSKNKKPVSHRLKWKSKHKVKVKNKIKDKILKKVNKEAPKKEVREEEVKKLIFNSDKEVERYYNQEKEKAKSFLNKVEKEKATSLLEVAKKQLEQIKIERKNIELLISDLNVHLGKIRDKIKQTSLEKQNNSSNIGLSKHLSGSLQGLEKEASGIVQVRGKLLEKEKKLVDQMSKLVLESEDKFQVSDKNSTQNLVENEMIKEKLILEAKSLLLQENEKMFLDNKDLDSIGRFARFKIRRLNKELKNLRKEKVDILKKKQILDISEEKAKEGLKTSLDRIEKIKRKYKKILV